MNKIVLTSSIKTNLLSLQRTAKLQDMTQNRLATGLKVSSAIDNPSSYYTASALNNRAKDLDALLDAMSQGIQTIKTAQTALETGIRLLSQAQAVGATAVQNAGVPTKIDKDWLIDNGVNENDIVSSRQELADRLAAAVNGDTIVVFGNISMGDEGIELKDGVSLVGAQKIIEDLGAQDMFGVSEDMSTISFNRSSSSLGIDMQSNTLLSDLKINFTTDNKLDGKGAVNASNSNNIRIRNINLDFNDNAPDETIHGAIQAVKSSIAFDGYVSINVHGSGRKTSGINGSRYGNTSTLTVGSNADIKITTSTIFGAGIEYGNWTIDGRVDIQTSGSFARGINEASSLSLAGKMSIKTTGGTAYGIYGNQNMTVKNTAYLAYNASASSDNTTISYEKGAVLSYPGYDKTFEALDNVLLKAISYEKISADAHFAEVDKSVLPAGTESGEIITEPRVSEEYFIAYTDILSQFNYLTADASYKGLNLLRGDSLKIKFNTDGSSFTEISGIKADSGGLGISGSKWSTISSVQKAMAEIQDAITEIRGTAAGLGNSYSVIDTRINFTENLINVLIEGADELTLADMNEESAAMLALQTRQQLAVNALSLASQAAQSVLKLF